VGLFSLWPLLNLFTMDCLTPLESSSVDRATCWGNMVAGAKQIVATTHYHKKVPRIRTKNCTPHGLVQYIDGLVDNTNTEIQRVDVVVHDCSKAYLRAFAKEFRLIPNTKVDGQFGGNWWLGEIIGGIFGVVAGGGIAAWLVVSATIIIPFWGAFVVVAAAATAGALAGVKLGFVIEQSANFVTFSKTLTFKCEEDRLVCSIDSIEKGSVPLPSNPTVVTLQGNPSINAMNV